MSETPNNELSLDELTNKRIYTVEKINAQMVTINECRVEVDSLQHELAEIDDLIAKNRRIEMEKTFVLTPDHTTMLVNGVYNGSYSDEEIAKMLAWDVDENGLTEDQEQRIAVLMSELPYAQHHINVNANTEVYKK